MSTQIKVAVVCHIRHRILIRNSFIVNLYGIIIGQCVCNCHIKVSGKSLFTIRAVMTESNRLLFCFCFPHHEFKSIRTTVQIVFFFIWCQLNLFSIQHKRGILDTISVSSDCSTKMRRIYLIIFSMIIS